MANPGIGDPSSRMRGSYHGLLRPAALFGVTVLVLFLGLAPVSAGPSKHAAADPCLTDPTSCLPDVDPPDLPVDPPDLPIDPEDPPDLPVDPPDLPIDPEDPPDLPVAPPEETPAEEVIDDLPGLPSDVVGAVPGLPGDDGSNGNGSSDEEAAPGRGEGSRGGVAVGGRSRSGPRGTTPGGGSAPDPAGTVDRQKAAEKRAGLGPDRPSAGISRRILELAERLRFPLVLFVAVLLFLVIQYRLDRRDPKFALAPIDTEMLVFE